MKEPYKVLSDIDAQWINNVITVIMRRLLYLLFALFLCGSFSSFAQGTQKPKIAVYVENKDNDNRLTEYVSQYFVNAIVKKGKYTVVERTKEFLAELKKEHDFERTGEVDDEQIAKMGKMDGVDFICAIRISSGNIYARVISVKTARVQMSAAPNYIGNYYNLSSSDDALLKEVFTSLFGPDPRPSASSASKRPKINTPDNSTGFMITSSFDSKGNIGFSIPFNRGFFQSSFGILASSGLFENYDDLIKNDRFLLSEETTTTVVDVYYQEKEVVTKKEYVVPVCQFTTSIGVRFKYIALDCGLGLFVGRNVRRTETGTDDYLLSTGESNELAPYFLIRPRVIGYFGEEMFFNVSFGYNYVFDAKVLNGLVFGVGFSF